VLTIGRVPSSRCLFAGSAAIPDALMRRETSSCAKISSGALTEIGGLIGKRFALRQCRIAAEGIRYLGKRAVGPKKPYGPIATMQSPDRQFMRAIFP
jgi:hypothetical protein